MLKKVVLIVLLGVSSMFAINKASLNISDLDVEIAVDFDLGQFQEDYAIDTYFMGFNLIEVNDEEAGSLVSGNFLIINDLPDRDGARLGFGMKLVSTEHKGESFLAAPIGAVLDLSLEGDTQRYWKSSVFYAPGALSFQDARAYFEVRTGIHLEPIENVRVFLEGRSIHTSYKIGEDIVFNETIYGGIQVGF